MQECADQPCADMVTVLCMTGTPVDTAVYVAWHVLGQMKAAHTAVQPDGLVNNFPQRWPAYSSQERISTLFGQLASSTVR